MEFVQSIERLDAMSLINGVPVAWELIQIADEQFKCISQAIYVPVSDFEIMIFGGEQARVCIFNAQDKTIRIETEDIFLEAMEF